MTYVDGEVILSKMLGIQVPQIPPPLQSLKSWHVLGLSIYGQNFLI